MTTRKAAVFVLFLFLALRPSSGTWAMKKKPLPAARSKSRPHVILGRPSVVGALPRELLARYLPTLRRKLEGCYERRRTPEGTVSGRVLAQFDVVRTNRVDRVRILESSIKNPALIRCVIRSLEGLVVPSNCKGGFDRVRLPVVFESNNVR